MSEELKPLPCPFCGGDAELPLFTYYVRCSVCRCEGPYERGPHEVAPAEAIAAWNRRATDAEPVAWQGGEGWESLAWELCADENGEDACNELIWEGGVILEPWGDRWMKYEGEAKRLIALVHKHAAHPPRTALTDEQIVVIADSLAWNVETPADQAPIIEFARAVITASEGAA